jgi:hypothetical protein
MNGSPWRRELPWLVAELAILVILLASNPPAVWFWFSLLVILLVYRWERLINR